MYISSFIYFSSTAIPFTELDLILLTFAVTAPSLRSCTSLVEGSWAEGGPAVFHYTHHIYTERSYTCTHVCKPWLQRGYGL